MVNRVKYELFLFGKTILLCFDSRVLTFFCVSINLFSFDHTIITLIFLSEMEKHPNCQMLMMCS